MGSTCSISDAERRQQKKKVQKQQRRNVVMEVRAMRKQYEKVFLAYDRDGDGCLDKTEWEPFYRDLLMSRGMSKRRAEEFAARPYVNQGRQSNAEFAAYGKIKISFEDFWNHLHTKSRLLPFTLDQLGAAKTYFSKWTPDIPAKRGLGSMGSKTNLFAREESASRLPPPVRKSVPPAVTVTAPAEPKPRPAAAPAPVPVPAVATAPLMTSTPPLRKVPSNSLLRDTKGPGGVPVDVHENIESSIAEVQKNIDQQRRLSSESAAKDDDDEDFDDFHPLSHAEAQNMHDELEKEILDAWNEESND